MIFLYPLYICLSLLWDPIEIRLWRRIFPPVSASLSYPPPRGLMGLLGVLSGGDQPPRPSPATTDGASAFSFSFYARLRARCQGFCPFLPMLFIFGSLWQYLTPHCMVVFSEGLSRSPPCPPFSPSSSLLCLTLAFSSSSYCNEDLGGSLGQRSFQA